MNYGLTIYNIASKESLTHCDTFTMYIRYLIVSNMQYVGEDFTMGAHVLHTIGYWMLGFVSTVSQDWIV